MTAETKAHRKKGGNLEYRLIPGERFHEAPGVFLDAVLPGGVERPKYHTVVLNNAFEPYDPERSVRYFRDARCIVVDRDPRDMFVEGSRFVLEFKNGHDPLVYRRISACLSIVN